jgi:hypothetical protein
MLNVSLELPHVWNAFIVKGLPIKSFPCLQVSKGKIIIRSIAPTADSLSGSVKKHCREEGIRECAVPIVGDR